MSSAPEIVELGDRTIHPLYTHGVQGKGASAMVIVPGFRECIIDEQKRVAAGGPVSVHPRRRAKPTECFQNAKEVIGHILDHRYLPIATGELQSLTSRQMGINAIVALNAECVRFTGHVKALILGAGYGNDINRVLRACKQATSVSFVCVEPDAFRAEKMRSEQAHLMSRDPNASVIKVFEGSVSETYEDVRACGPYDIVVSVMSFHHVAGRSWEPSEPLGALLTDRGAIVGTYFDHDSFFSMENQIVTETCSNVHVAELKMDPCPQDPAILGVRRTTVFTTVFDDPVMSPELIHIFCSRHSLQPEIFRGRSILNAHTDILKDIPYSKDILGSAVPAITTVVIARRLADVPIPAPCALMAYDVPPVPKGKMLSDEDVPHFRSLNYAVAIKRDGIAGVMVLDALGFRGVGLSYPDVLRFKRPRFLQVELMPDGRLYALDMLPESFVYPCAPFPFRYSFMVEVVAALQSCGVPIEVNVHQPVRSTYDLNNWVNTNTWGRDQRDAEGNPGHEGLVLVPYAPAHSGGYTNVRYIKVVRTIDEKLADGNVYEIEIQDALEPVGCKRHGPDQECRKCAGSNRPLRTVGVRGRVLRQRGVHAYDKTTANPDGVVTQIMRAPPFRSALAALSLQLDVRFDPLDLKGLDFSSFQMPDVESVPENTWARLYLMRATVPDKYSRYVAEWIRLKALKEKELEDLERVRVDMAPVVSCTPDQDEPIIDY